MFRYLLSFFLFSGGGHIDQNGIFDYNVKKKKKKKITDKRKKKKKRKKKRNEFRPKSNCESTESNIHLRNKFDFWNVHGIMNTSGLLQSK